MFKKIIKLFLSRFDFELVKISFLERKTITGVLQQIKKNWQPSVVIDVGAAFGSWSEKCSKFFPKAKYILVEPLVEYDKCLKETINKIGHAQYFSFALSAEEGNKLFNVHEDLVGSSLNIEVEGGGVDGKKREVICTTLDKLAEEHKIGDNILLKIDVQGAELEVLRGAKEIIKKVECIIMEVSLFKSFVGGPDLYDVVSFMKESGFVVYDVFGFLYRPYDGALSQVDLVFVKEGGKFRSFHGYANPDQRASQNQRYRDANQRILKI